MNKPESNILIKLLHIELVYAGMDVNLWTYKIAKKAKKIHKKADKKVN